MSADDAAALPRATAAPQPPGAAEIYFVLRDLIDPEVGINVVDLGMIGEIAVAQDGAVIVEMMPTTPGCPMHDVLSEGARLLVGRMAGVASVEVRFVYDPPWTPGRIAPEARALLGMQ